MRIVMVIPNLHYSGAPKILAWVGNSLAKRGDRVSIVSLYGQDESHSLENVELVKLKVKRSKNKLVRISMGLFPTLKALDEYVQQENPDVLITFLDTVSYVYMLVNRLHRRTKIIASERVDPYQRKGLLAKIRYHLMNYADGTVFQTDGARDFFHGNKKVYEHSVVIPNPVILSSEQKNQGRCPFEEREKVIVSVGRLVNEQKRFDVMIDAFAIVHKERPDYQLVIYGNGPDEEMLRQLIAYKGLADAICLAGKTDRVLKVLNTAAAFVITSDYEGIPNTLIEALSVGVPSVATDCSPGGAKLLIENGLNGYIVPRGDAKAVAKMMLQVIGSKEISDLFSQEGPRVIERFSEERIARQWMDYVDSVVK